MSITNKLYESIAKKCWHVLDADGYYELLAIANRIDEQHRKALENVNELQKLCRDMYAVISDRNSWWDCMRRDTRCFADRMHELGIEVE